MVSMQGLDIVVFINIELVDEAFLSRFCDFSGMLSLLSVNPKR